MSVFAKISGFLVLCMFVATASWAQNAPQFKLPVECTLGEDCFLQQMPDMDLGPNARDPYCGIATYDGHKGTDFRLRYFSDIEKSVPVVASLEGVVLRLRDGIADRLVVNNIDRKNIENIECGNGVVIDHGDGWQSQYCHMKQGSINVVKGQKVDAGDRLGAVGSSGMAQFAHIHLSITKDNKPIDPFTNRALGAACEESAQFKDDLWSDDLIVDVGREPTQILDIGMSDGVVDHNRLGVQPPPFPTKNSKALVGWASFINLNKGDMLNLKIIAPDASIFSENHVAPLDRAKASYSFFAGKKGQPRAGKYKVEVVILRADKTQIQESRAFEIQ